MPARLEPERTRLLLEVGELTARHFVQIDLGSAGAEVGLEGEILRPNRLEVEGDLPDRGGIEPGVAVAATQGFDDRTEIGLRGQTRHGVDRRIDRVDAGFHRRQHRCRGDARGVMGMEMNRQVGFLAQRREQDLGRRRFEEPGHILDADDMGAGPLQFAGQADIVVEVVFGPRRIENVAGIADGAPRTACRFRRPRRSTPAYSRPS